MRRRSQIILLACTAVGSITAQLATVLYASSQGAAERNDRAEMDLAADVLRASQAEVAAERMIVMSRGYVLTHEPELLARAHGAAAKLQETLQRLEQEASALGEGPLFVSVLVSADRYREALQRFLNDDAATPQDVADALRKRVVPKRDGFEGDVEELITRRQQQIAGLHAATHELAARVVPVMIGTCSLGLLASIFLTPLALQKLDGAEPVGDPGEPRSDARESAAVIPPARRSNMVIDPKSIQILPERATLLGVSRPANDDARRR